MTSVQGGTGAALVLHDDQRVLTLIRDVLADEGFDVATLESSFAALGGRRVAQIDLVVLGLTAVDDRDLDVVRLLREQCPRATLLLLFPAMLRERAVSALAMGADAYLPEPFYPQELVAIARRVGARRNAERAGPITDDRIAAPEPGLRPSPPSRETPSSAPLGAPSSRPTPVEKLAAGVAHSIRNPLQIVELMISATEFGEDLDLTGIREQTTRIASVVEGLTRFGSTLREAPRAVDVDALIRELFDFTGVGAPAVELDLAGGPLTVLAEIEPLTAALEVLRNRALRLTPTDGRIVVSTGGDHNEIEVIVRDGGPPPPEDTWDEFFEPTPDPDAVQDGTWLEMAAFAGTIRNHGGVVRVGTTPDNGTIIGLRLPRHGDTT